ncbi:hypothetical protein GCM10009624_22220 [Gordonia sinesedis]
MTSPGAPDSSPKDAAPGSADASELIAPPKSELNAAQTAWESMSISAILGLVAKMNGSRAQGDAQAVLIAVGKARQVSSRLGSGVFGGDMLLGLGADQSVVAAQELAHTVDAASTPADEAASAFQRAGGVLEATRGRSGELVALQQEMQRTPESAPSVRGRVRSLMTSTYSSPMIDIGGRPIANPGESQIAGLGPAAGSGGGPSGPGGPGGGGPGSPGQSAAVTDIDDPARSTPGGSPGSTSGQPPTPTAPQAVPAAASGAVPPGGAGPGGPPGTGTPGGLLRGGWGAPVDRSGTSDRTGARDGSGRSTQAGSGTGLPGGGADGTTGQVGGLGAGDGMSGGSGAGGVPGAAVGGLPLGPPVSPGPGPTATPTAASAGTGGSGGPTSATPSRPVPAGTPPIGGRHRTDDERHRPAAYLHTRDHGASIVGDLPLVGPPVIGDWAPAAPVGTGGTPMAPAGHHRSGTERTSVAGGGTAPTPAENPGHTAADERPDAPRHAPDGESRRGAPGSESPDDGSSDTGTGPDPGTGTDPGTDIGTGRAGRE